MQRGPFQKSGNCKSDELKYYKRRKNRIKHGKLNTTLDVINESSETENYESRECCSSQQKGKERMSRKLERNIVGLVRGSEENYGEKRSQSNQANAWSSNYVHKSSNKNAYSRNEAHDNNEFRRNYRRDSVCGNTSDMLDKDGNPGEGTRENSEISNGRENVISIGERDQSTNDGQLLVIILFYDDSNDGDFVVVFVFQ